MLYAKIISFYIQNNIDKTNYLWYISINIIDKSMIIEEIKEENHMKKILALALSLVLCLAMAGGVLA